MARKKRGRATGARRNDDDRIEVQGADVRSGTDDVRTTSRNIDQLSYADRDYGFSGRDGFQEGNYSSYYGRGTAGERNAPSASGYSGAGYDRGGTDIPRPDREPPDAVRVDDDDPERGNVAPPPRPPSPPSSSSPPNLLQ